MNKIYNKKGLWIHDHNGKETILWGLCKSYTENLDYTYEVMKKAVAGDIASIEALVFLSAANLALGCRNNEFETYKNLGGDFRPLSAITYIPPFFKREVWNEITAVKKDIMNFPIKRLDISNTSWENVECLIQET